VSLTVCQFLNVVCPNDLSSSMFKALEAQRLSDWHPGCCSAMTVQEGLRLATPWRGFDRRMWLTFMSRRVGIVASLVFLSAILFLAHAVVAETVFYVDPNWGGQANGSASAPWPSLNSSAWATINAALAADAVTVYFSARAASSDTNQTTTTALNINRTNSSSNRLTLDGMSRYNTNDAAPSWAIYIGSSRFQITSAYPVSTNNASPSSQERNYWTLRGFKVVATNGQIMFLDKIRDVIIEGNELMHTGTPSVGPGLIVGSSHLTGFAGTNVTIRRNSVHDTLGEGIYIGGWYGLAPGVGAGDTLLIEDNIVHNSGAFGAEGDGIDIKDGWTNVIVRNNTLSKDVTVNSQNDGIITNSAALIEGNFLYNWGRNGITLTNYYHAFDGFWTGAIVRNNVVVACGGASSLSWGFGIAYPEAPGTFSFVTPAIYNNTVYGTVKAGSPGAARGIYIGPTVATTVAVYNNIVAATDGIHFEAPAGVLGAHGNNDYWHSGAGTVARYGSNSYTATTITAFESNSLSIIPLFVNTGPPYIRMNFALQSTSPLCGRNMGAIPCSATATSPQLPTSLRVQ
jgi:hypothetical protein